MRYSWIVVQALARKSNPDLIYYAKQVAGMMEKSPWFTAPFPVNITSLPVLRQHIQEMETEFNKPYQGKASTSKIRAARDVVENDLFLIGNYVNGIAARNGDKGGSIILSAGMKYRVHGKRKAYIFKVINSKAQQQAVKATTERIERDAVYQWQIKKFNEARFRTVDTNFRASYNYKDLERGTKYNFRVITTLRKGTTVTSEVLELVVI